MNTQPQDRLLEYSLERIYRDERDVDRSQQIIAAWERGVSGTGLSDMDAAAPTLKSSPRAMLWPALAASLLLGLVLIVAIERPHPAAFVSSTVSMQVAKAEHFSARSDAPAGAWILLPDADAQLSTASGHELFVSGPALLKLERTESDQLALELLLGDVRVQQPTGGALVCSTGFGSLESRDEGALRCSVQLTDASAWESSSSPLTLVASVRELSRYAHVEVQSGSCQARFQNRSVTLASGSAEWFASEQPSPFLARLADQRKFDELLEALSGADEEKLIAQKKKRQLPLYANEDGTIASLLALLAAEPSRWSQVEQATSAAFRTDRARPWQREGLLYLLVRSPAPQALELLGELWLDSSEYFSVDDVVALAERGAPAFRAALDAIVAAGEAAPEQLVLASAQLALQGSDAGLFHLLAFLDPPSLEPRDLPYTLLAAVALHELGETEFLTFAHRSIQIEVEDYIEMGEFERAAEFLAPAPFFEDWRRSAQPRRLSYFVREVNRDMDARRETLAQPDALRTALGQLETD